MRKLDLYLSKEFLSNLLICFGLSLIVFILNSLWLYVDELVGKGLGAEIVAELFFNLIISIIPNATGAAVLAASIMTWGKLAERSELTACYSSGISFYRSLRPILVIVLVLGSFVHHLADRIIPIRTVDFFSLMYDIRTSKPEINLPENQFFDQIEGYTIKVARKDQESGML